MRAILGVALLTLAAACSDDEGENITRQPIFPTDSGGGGYENDGLFEPVAVGFEIIAGLGPIGQILPYSVDGQAFLPALVLRFGSTEFFETGDDLEQDLNSCELVAVGWEPIGTQNQILNRSRDGSGQVELWQTYDFAFPTNPDNYFHTCGGSFAADGDGYVDPENWGSGGEDLIDKFLGAHVAIGFGPMSQYLKDAFTDFDAAKKKIGKDYNYFTQYVAINDKSGAFIAEDWTIGRTWEWDLKTGEISSEPDPDQPGRELLVPTPLDPEGGWVNSCYLQTGAYWYQDFPLMDLDNLKDGAPKKSFQ